MSTSGSLLLFVVNIYLIHCKAASYPIYNGTGSHFEAGVSIGEQAKYKIQQYISTYPRMTTLRNCLLTGCAVEFKDLVQYNQQIWPQYFDELNGIAQGADVDVIDLELLSLKREILEILDESQPKPMDLECSDIFLNGKQFQGFGHNEDGWQNVMRDGYISHYKIMNNSKIENEFIAFEYPASITGHAFGFNQFGVASSLNAVFPSNYTIPARSYYFLSRAVMDAHNISHAIDIINDFKDGDPACSYGASFNIGYMDKNNDGKITMANIEISNYDVSVQYYEPQQYGYHFNNYLRLNVAQNLEESSIHRLNRTVELIEENGLNTKEDVLNILGDTDDAQYPLYRDSSFPDDLSTLATALFDIGEQSLSIYENCNPKTCHPTITMQFDSFRNEQLCTN